jgi:hypothetical protein
MEPLDFSVRLGVYRGRVYLFNADEREECPELGVVELAPVVA